MEWSDLQHLAVALGVGLLIGVERERRRLELPSDRMLAGVRSFALAGLLGGICAQLGDGMLITGGLAVVALATVGYWRTSGEDPGLTTELALVLVFALGVLSLPHPGLAGGLAVIVTLLLAAKQRIHRFSRELISEQEMQDGLLLLAAVLVVLPLLPDRALDPLGVINPARVGLLVVLVMGISALGHVTLRLVGVRRGMAIAGFFAGYVSSTAAVAGFGDRVREDASVLRPAVAAAMLANLASLSLFLPLYLAVSLPALSLIAPAMAAGGLILLLGGLAGLRGGDGAEVEAPTEKRRMFQFSHALALAALITAVVAVSTLLHHWLGAEAAVLAAVGAALAELHAAGASLAQMHAGQALNDASLRWGFVGMLFASAAAKSALAWISGGRAYGLRVTVGLQAMALSAALATWLRG
ncbi:MAG: MgtC/SapB family protein [Xanthomonadales bacterium]|nr:MgtC/SapB family protein [Xanthomonadales bacterium]